MACRGEDMLRFMKTEEGCVCSNEEKRKRKRFSQCGGLRPAKTLLGQ